MLTKSAYALMFGLAAKKETVVMIDTDGLPSTARIGYSDYFGSSGRDAFSIFNSNAFNSGKPNTTGLYFGTGDTSPSVKDYTLSGEIITGLSSDTVKTTISVSDGYTELQATVVVTNTKSSSVTIKEIGLFGLFSADNIVKPVLMDRIVLPTPITLVVGESKSITYNLRPTY